MSTNNWLKGLELLQADRQQKLKLVLETHCNWLFVQEPLWPPETFPRPSSTRTTTPSWPATHTTRPAGFTARLTRRVCTTSQPMHPHLILGNMQPRPLQPLLIIDQYRSVFVWFNFNLIWFSYNLRTWWTLRVHIHRRQHRDCSLNIHSFSTHHHRGVMIMIIIILINQSM